ncbi:MAG: phosphoribosyltransferase family protein [Dehalococcoidia bacterium]
MQDELIQLLAARRGHFSLESGHHGDLWLHLELLFLRPRAIQPFAQELARRLSVHTIDAVCGPLVEGAFVAQLVAAELDVEFSYAEPIRHPDRSGLYPVEYRLPDALRQTVRGKSVAIVNDVINAGSAVGGTFRDLEACGARPVAIGTLLVLGSWTARFAADKGIPLECLASLSNTIWTPSTCPLCADGTPLDRSSETMPSAAIAE